MAFARLRCGRKKLQKLDKNGEYYTVIEKQLEQEIYPRTNRRENNLVNPNQTVIREEVLTDYKNPTCVYLF